MHLSLLPLTHWALVMPYYVIYSPWSTLVQVMACCLTAPSHCLNQYWLIISEFLCIHLTAISQNDVFPRYRFENYLFKTTGTSPRGQWVDTWKPRQDGCYFANNIFTNNIFTCIFFIEYFWISNKVSLKYACTSGCFWDLASIGSDNGLTPYRWQDITRTNVDKDVWYVCHMAPLGNISHGCGNNVFSPSNKMTNLLQRLY